MRIKRGGRAVEGARLESGYTATYRGFESLPLCNQLEIGLLDKGADFE